MLDSDLPLASLSPVWTGSPHRRAGRGGYRPEAVVVHLMDGTLRGTDAWFQDPRSRVSAHYGIGRGGAVHQYVREADTAWHAGRVYQPTWAGVRRGVSPNLYTVGIEHEGRLGDAWPEAMMEASAALIADVCRRWQIPIDRAHVVGHREIYARKACPGDEVDLDQLVRMARADSKPDTAEPGVSSVETASYTAAVREVATRVQLSIRTAPTSQSTRLRTEPRGAALDTVGWTSSGEAVYGNAHWYRLEDGGWAWAGGTAAPAPSLLCHSNPARTATSPGRSAALEPVLIYQALADERDGERVASRLFVGRTVKEVRDEE